MKDVGADVDKIAIKTISGCYRGVVAACKVQKDEELYFIPHSELMYDDNLKENPVAKAIYASEENKTFNEGKGLSGRGAIALGILEENLKGEDSRFSTYIKRFPTNFDEYPAYYSEEELKMLENTSCRTEIEEENEIIKSDFDFICRVVPTISWTIEDYKIAYL